MTDPDTSYRRVRFLKEVPRFTGTDLEVYGPFEEGDTEKLPEGNAEILSNRYNAEYIDEKEGVSRDARVV